MTVNQTFMVLDTPRRQEDPFKTRLCKSYAVGGDEDCKYGVHCKFIHPEDEEQYMRLIEYTEEYRRVKGDVQKEVQHLHGLKRTINDAIKANAIDEWINRRIRLFNEVYPKAPNYYDLHGMSTRGAVNYVMDICQMMRINNISTSWLETGRGNQTLIIFH
ncbi:Protein CBG13776 [Caenorhabditis briggsae]|nr:Protein CBG13776 [Caenorhabditis briggsae]CAP32515.2 Protein CBG13776 [Caenorhabditis briggsae]